MPWPRSRRTHSGDPRRRLGINRVPITLSKAMDGSGMIGVLESKLICGQII
jgi:hypothetical protein